MNLSNFTLLTRNLTNISLIDRERLKKILDNEKVYEFLFQIDVLKYRFLNFICVRKVIGQFDRGHMCVYVCDRDALPRVESENIFLIVSIGRVF